MSSLLKTYNPSGHTFAKPVRSHEFTTSGPFKGIKNICVRPGADDNKKYPSLINGKQVKYKQS